jgi:hypothetical protein
MPTVRTFGCAAAVGGDILVTGAIATPAAAGLVADVKLHALTTAGWTATPSSAPTPGPTYGSCGAECWATRNSLPIASTDSAQACAVVGALVYMYQYDQPSPSGQGFHKYDSAADTWEAGSTLLTDAHRFSLGPGSSQV